MSTTDAAAVEQSLDAITDALLTASRLLVAISARSIALVDETITIPQFRTLVILSNEGPVNLATLASLLDVQPSTIGRMVDRLVSAGLIDRRYIPPRAANWSPSSPHAGAGWCSKSPPTGATNWPAWWRRCPPASGEAWCAPWLRSPRPAASHPASTSDNPVETARNTAHRPTKHRLIRPGPGRQNPRPSVQLRRYRRLPAIPRPPPRLTTSAETVA